MKYSNNYFNISPEVLWTNLKGLMFGSQHDMRFVGLSILEAICFASAEGCKKVLIGM
jgi:hypothetical protein